jgi:hypothetical protein
LHLWWNGIVCMRQVVIFSVEWGWRRMIEHLDKVTKNIITS